ncbi:MAG: hypothetical protein WA459_09775 [Stellaceae bacterium]
MGRNAAAAWSADPDFMVRHVWTDHLPLAEVERVAPNEDIPNVEFGMEALAALAAQDANAFGAALAELPALYSAWIQAQQGIIGTLEHSRVGRNR